MSLASELLQNLQSAQSESARTAVDYMDGNQLPHLEAYLSLEGFGIKDWKKRGVLPVFENITGHVIDQSAKTYQQQPTRTVVNSAGAIDENATELYGMLLDDSNATETLQHCDYLSRLLKTSVILTQYDDTSRRLFFEAMSQDNCDISYNRKTRSTDALLYTGGNVGSSGDSIYYFWTPDAITTYEVPTGSGTPDALKQTEKEQNTYGIVPVSVLYDIRPPRYGFWSSSVWDELIQLNIAANLFQTEMKFNQRYGAIGALFTDAEIAEGQAVGPDAVVRLVKQFQEDTPFLSYESPQVQIDQFLDWLNSFRESVGRNWGVNIKMHGDASADSGFKLVVEEMPTLELRKKRLPAASTFEQELYRSVLAVSNIKGLGLPAGSRLKVEFPEPDLPVNKKEQWEIAQGEMAFGVLTKEDYLKQKYPSWSDEQVGEYLARARAAVVGTAPSFGGVVDGE